jgi:hypothetical protein
MRDGLSIIILFLLPTWLAGMFALWRFKRIRQTTTARVYLAFITVFLWIMLFMLMLQIWLRLFPPF